MAAWILVFRWRSRFIEVNQLVEYMLCGPYSLRRGDCLPQGLAQVSLVFFMLVLLFAVNTDEKISHHDYVEGYNKWLARFYQI